MKVLSLFSGVGGFDLGLERAGMETVFQCEWDKHATKILEKHWPNVPRWGDVSTLTGQYVIDHAPVIDVVAWGSPCQDLSVAGKRAGLQGARSGLFYEGVRIIKEIKELTNGKYPRISIWENVAGALSSGAGADFGQVLTEMDEAGSCFSEWRILDAQYFGVPQRRRRVFLVSVFDPATAARCPDPLLPLGQSVRRDIETGAATRQEPAGETTTSFGSSNFGGWAETDTAITLSARDHKGGNTVAVESFTPSQFAQYTEGVVTMRANGGDLGGGSETLVTFTKGKRAQTVDDDETWDENRPAPTLNSFDQGDTRATTIVVSEHDRTYRQVTGALLGRDSFGPNHEGARDGKLILEQTELVIGFSHTQGLSAQPSEAAWPTLRTEGNGMAVAIPIQDGREMEKHQNGLGVAEEGSPAYTLDQTGAQAVAYSIREDAKANTFSATELDRANALSALRPSPQSHHAQMFIAEGTEAVAFDGYNQTISDVAQTIRADKSDGDHVGMVLQPQAIAFQPGTMIRMSGGVWDELAPTLRAEAKRGDNEPHVAVVAPSLTASNDPSQSPQSAEVTQQVTAVHQATMAVRRLTPLECERLMGWPDDWTAGQSDTHRYKQCGNGVASPVATWIAQQLLATDASTTDTDHA